MSNEQGESKWAIHSIMHQNKQKYRQLGASLLLTSSFAQHKQKANQKKREKLEIIAGNQITYHQEVLQARGIGADENKCLDFRIDVSLSNIDKLKSHARRLMDEETKKLGKENQQQENPEEARITTAESEQFSAGSNFRINKKPNKRKIVKGRPQMYAITKKRTFLLNLLEDEAISSSLTKQTSDRQMIQQLLNKNNLLTFISTTNEKMESKNLYDNYQRHKTIEQVGKVHHQKRFNPRRTSQKMLHPFSTKSKPPHSHLPHQSSDAQSESLKNYVFCLKKRRYSSIKTIQ